MNKKLSLLFSSIGLLALPVITLAALDPAQWITRLATNILTIILWPIFISVVIIMIIWAGFLFVTANGDPSKISSAKKALVWAIVGIIVAVLAYSAYNTIKVLILG